MSTIEKSVEVNVPVRNAFNQWTKFEEFHRFMEGAHKLQRLDGRRSHRISGIGEQEKECEVEIVE